MSEAEKNSAATLSHSGWKCKRVRFGEEFNCIPLKSKERHAPLIAGFRVGQQKSRRIQCTTNGPRHETTTNFQSKHAYASEKKTGERTISERHTACMDGDRTR